jgi:RNA ligase (TIGR02306 family)
MRKLASIQLIRDLLPIEGADVIEMAKVNEWVTVVKKNEFKIGEKCVYFEIDSFLPKTEVFQFLDGRCNKKMLNEEGYRLKTIKLRGQISQGLVLPISSFNSVLSTDMEVGTDVSELLNVKLYEEPMSAQLASISKGNFPNFIPKTDEERIQNLPEYFENCQENLFEVTLKMDGSSMTVYYKLDKEEPFGVCSRNLELKEHPDSTSTFWIVARNLQLEETLKAVCFKLNTSFALQGELAGEGIQSNRAKLKGHNYFIFNVFNISEQRYLTPGERKDFMTILNQESPVEIKHVLIIDPEMPVFKKYKTFSELHNFVSSVPSVNGTLPEGLVFKCVNKNISFKCINNNYLLKEK